MSKKIAVKCIIEMANEFMKTSPDDAKQDRLSMATFVESILHKTKNYAGFNYLQDYSSPDCDTSRVFFYVSHNL